MHHQEAGENWRVENVGEEKKMGGRIEKAR